MISRTFSRFNTTNTVIAATENEKVFDEVLAWCDRCELLFSRFDPSSELFKLNHAADRPVKVDEKLAALIESAVSYCRETDGLFDVTMGGVTRLWDFKSRIVPSREEVEAALPHVGFNHVAVSDGSVLLRDPLACIDLGGIAKGYIADGILALLRKRGVAHALVNLGGNVAVMGGKPDGERWNIGIRRPFPSSAMPLPLAFATLLLADGAVVTSGVYERAFVQEKRLYHHILDPRTGFPAQTDLLSATIVTRHALDADGFTTALVIMGSNKALSFAERHPALEAVLVTDEGDVLATSGIGTEIPFELLDEGK